MLPPASVDVPPVGRLGMDRHSRHLFREGMVDKSRQRLRCIGCRGIRITIPHSGDRGWG